MISFIIFVFGFLLQLVFYRYFSTGGAGVNIMLILTVEIALLEGSFMGEIFGFMSGLFEDLLVFGIIGERALVRAIIGFMAGKLRGKFSIQNTAFQFFLVLVVFIIHGYSISIIRIIFGIQHAGVASIMLNALINALVAPAVFFIIRKINAR